MLNTWMLATRSHLARVAGLWSLVAIVALLLSGCASWVAQPPQVQVVSLERLAAEGFELRFTLKLRVQNPNSAAIQWEGLALDLDVNGRPLATGVSAASGQVAGFGEAIISLPVSVNAVVAVRQMLGLLDGSPRGELPYVIRGRLGGGALGATAFTSEGVLKLPK